jgi:hypothetical protein
MPTDDERRAALSALADLSGFDVEMFDRPFPSRPWADVVPSELWYRREILEHWKPTERLRLYRMLESMLGQVHAETLMAYLPPVPWQVLATHGVYPRTRDAA